MNDLQLYTVSQQRIADLHREAAQIHQARSVSARRTRLRFVSPRLVFGRRAYRLAEQ